MESLLGAHARFMANIEDSLAALDLTVRLEHLLEQGKGDLIERAAHRIQAEGGDGRSLLAIAQDCACTADQELATGQRTARLFAVPVIFDDTPEVPGAPLACVQLIRQSLMASGMLDLSRPGAGVEMDEWLWTQADLSTLGLRDMRKILTSLAADPQRSISVSPSADGPDADGAWRAEVMGQPRHLRWIVGCFTSASGQVEDSEDGQEGDHGFTQEQMDAFMETASNLLSMELGMGVEVGLPGSMAHQIRSGAFDEVSNGMLDACEVARESQIGDLILRTMSLDDSVMGASASDAPARCRLHLELVLISEGHVNLQLAQFDIDCDMASASDQLQDLAAVLREHGGVSRVDSVHHAFRGLNGVLSDGSSAQRQRVAGSGEDDGFESSEVGSHFWSEAAARGRNPVQFLH